MIVFSDPYEKRGGGQVCLEYMLAFTERAGVEQFALVMPPRGRAQIDIPEVCKTYDTWEDLSGDAQVGRGVVVVSNANRAFPRDIWAARSLRHLGFSVSTVAIVHNYPVTLAKSAALRLSLPLFDHILADEPGLRRLNRKMRTPPWVAPVSSGQSLPKENIRFSGTVKSFGRPDPSKGMDYLVPVFRELEAVGLECKVALGHTLENRGRYVARLRESLSRWLEDGYQTQAWIQPGDIFIVPSVGGETTCQAAQEAIARGAYVVATDIGLLPYLCPEGGGYVSVPSKDSDAILHGVLEAIAMSGDDFDASVRRSANQIVQRSGLYYDSVVRFLIKADSTVD